MSSTRRPNHPAIRCRGGGLALALLAIAIAVLVAAPGDAAAGMIVAPKAGHELKSSPVRVSVRAAWRVQTLRVRLNGVNLSPEFGRAEIHKHNVRTVRVSASHGLRYGKNVLRVTKKRFAHKRHRDAVHFRLTRDRPLVGAGRDRRIEIARSISLDGHASRPRHRTRGHHPRSGAKPSSAAGLRMRWRLVRKPAGSRAKIRHARRARPRLKHVDDPGRYVAKLVVADHGVRSSADRVAITGLVGTPLVPIDTAATVQGQQGIAIGYHPAEQGGRAPQGPNEEFFPVGSGDELQLVVLDRDTLETLDTWSGPATETGVQELNEKLSSYEDNALAIVTAWRSSQWFDGATDALTGTSGQGVAAIGASAPGDDEIAAYGLEHGGQLSWVGAPGFPRGEAWEAGIGNGPHALQGFLSPDNDENYAYLATDPTTYDVAPQTGSGSGGGAELDVGEQRATVNPLPAGEGGFAVAYYDGESLDYADSSGVPSGPRTYVTRNADGSPNYGGMGQMAGDIKAAAASPTPLLIAIHSLGPAPLAQIGEQPPKYQGNFDPVLAVELDQLAAAVARAGGHEQAIYGMSTQPTGNDSYALLGSNYATIDGLGQEGSGVDAGSQIGPSGGTTVSGILAKDKRGRYLPKATAGAPLGPALAELIVAEPSEWPYSSTPGEQAALKCIGNAQGLGPDPRAAYWMQTYNQTKWDDIQAAVAKMQPSDCPDPVIGQGDFTNVRAEIAKEIGWLTKVNSYLGALAAPFTTDGDGLASFADLQAITQDVVGAVKPPPTSSSGIDAMAIFADVADVLEVGEVPGAGAVAALFFLGDDLTTNTDNGPTIDWEQRVEAASSNVGQALVKQLKDISSRQEQLVDIIVADYAKLSTVGTKGQCTPGEPGCDPQWQFTQPQQNAASRAYEISAKRQIWSGVLPAAYPFVLYANSDPGSFGGEFEGPQEQISGIECQFAQEFPVQEPTFLRYGIREVQNTKFMVFSQENFKGGRSTPRPTMFPPTSLLTPLFAPLDPGGDPDKGGLGLDRYEFMVDNWELGGLGDADTSRGPWRGC